MNTFTKYTLRYLEEKKESLDLNSCIVEKSKDERNVLKINCNGKWIYNGSKYNVENDVNTFIKRIKKINDFTIIIVFGLGCAEHIVQLMNMTKESNKIIIIEPDVNIIEKFKSLDCFNKVIEDFRIEILSFNESLIKSALARYVKDYDINNVNIISYTNYERLYENQFTKLLEIYKNHISTKIINYNTSELLSKNFFECYIKNIPNLVKSIPINSLRNIYKDKPAIIVSAGPSLEKNIKLLKETKDKFVIICSERTLKPLINLNIKPDFICIVDPRDEMYNMIKEYYTYDIPLIYYEYANHTAVSKYSHDKIFFTTHLSKKITDELLQDDILKFSVGGSVAHSCTEAAISMGCNPIIFIGQDLAYTDNKSHADIAKFGNYAEVVDENLMLVDDIHGNKVPTSLTLNQFRIHFEGLIDLYKDINFINCTEGGANIAGTEIKKLSEVVENFKFDINKKKFNNMNKIDIYSKNVLSKINEYVEILDEIIKLSEEIISDSKNIYKFYKLNDYKSIRIEMGKFTDRSSQLKDKYESVEFIGDLLSPLFNQFLINEDKLLNNGIESFSTYTRLIYENIMLASKHTITTLNDIKLQINESR